MVSASTAARRCFASLEAAAGSSGATYTTSVPLGVLRLRHMSLTAVRDTVEQMSAPIVRELATYQPETIALASGTARALLRVGRNLGMIGAEERHVPSGVFCDLARQLYQLSPAALIELGVTKTRLDTISVGAAIYATVLARLSRPVIYIARAALREGVLVDHVRSQPERARVSDSAPTPARCHCAVTFSQR